MKNIFSEKNNGVNLVVGAGISGAVIAERIANVLDEKVLIIDKNTFVGGLCHDYKNRNGILVNKFGTHIFHTSNKFVWDYVNSFSEFYTFYHKASACIDGIKVNLPFNIFSLYQLFPESQAKKLEYKLLNLFPYNYDADIGNLKAAGDNDLNFLADFILNKFSRPYAEKLCQEFPADIDKQLPYAFIRVSKDSRFYTNKFQGIPQKGYTVLIENMLKNHNIELSLSTDYNYLISKNFKRIFFTGSIDDCFNYKFGMLQYKSVLLKSEETAATGETDYSVVKYPWDFDFSAVHNFTGNGKNISAKEFWSDYVYGENERAYPVRNSENIQLYKKYKDYAKIFPEIYFLGRQGMFKPYSMAGAVEDSLKLFNNLTSLTDKFIDGIVDNCR